MDIDFHFSLAAAAADLQCLAQQLSSRTHTNSELI
jgi:hypothetical protein